MKNNMSYFIFQGRKTTSEALLLVIGISIALSCFAGIGYFTDTFQSTALQNSNRQILDFQIRYSEKTSYRQSFLYEEGINWTVEEYADFQERMIDEFQVNSDINIVDSMQFRIIDAWDLSFYNDYSDAPISEHPYGEDVYFSLFKLFEVDQNFYTSDRFNDYFAIIEGNYPQNDNEILVDIQFAHYMNLSIGPNQTLKLADISPTTRFNPNTYDFKHIFSSYPMSNITVAGFYACKNPIFAVGNSFFQTDYIFNEKDSQIGPRNDFSFSYPFTLTPCFANFNKSNPIGNSIVGNIVHDLPATMSFNINVYDGLGLFIDRSLIDYDRLTMFNSYLNENTNSINIDLNEEYILNNFLGIEISAIRHNLTLIKIFTQIANIPIIIFALYIGAKSIKFEQKNRLEEFMKLRSKGIQEKMLRDQILIEGVFLGLTSSLIGSLLGFGIYSLVDTLLLKIFNSFLYVNNLVFSPSIGTFLITFLIGMAITQIGSVMSLLYISKLPTNKLISIVNEYEVENNVDESIFEKKHRSSSKIKLNLDSKKNTSPSFLKKNEIINDNSIVSEKKVISEKIKKPKKRKKDKASNNSNVYKTEFTGLKRRHIGAIILAFVFACIPIIFILLIRFQDMFTGNMRLLIQFILINNISLLVFLAITLLSPIILTIVIIKLITKKDQRFFGRLSQKLSWIILQKRSKLCARNMLRRKQYHSLMVIIAVFITLFSFSNVFLNSYSKFDKIQTNISAGADMRITYPQIQFIDSEFYTGLEFSTNIQNYSDIINFEGELKNITNNNNASFVNDILTSFSEPLTINSQSVTGSKLFITNISKYYQMITESGKFEPIKGDFSKLSHFIQEILSFDENICPAITNSKFLENRLISVGDKINITHIFYNSEINGLEYQNIQIQIVDIIDTLPGLYNTADTLNGNQNQDFVIIDQSYINLDMDNLPSFQLIQFFDLNDSIQIENNIVTQKVEDVAINYRNIQDIQFYDNSWNDKLIDFTDDSNNIYLIYYVEFSIFGILIALSVSIVFQMVRKNSKYDEGILITHGMGKRGINTLYFGDLFVIFSISTIVGLTLGIFYSTLFLQGFNLLFYGSSTIKTLIFFNIYEILGIILLLPLISYVLFLINKLINSKLKIVDVFHNF